MSSAGVSWRWADEQECCADAGALGVLQIPRASFKGAELTPAIALTGIMTLFLKAHSRLQPGTLSSILSDTAVISTMNYSFPADESGGIACQVID